MPENLPISERPIEDLPGHWLLARLGKRVLGMREVLNRYSDNLAAIAVVATKNPGTTPSEGSHE